jgi:hypothetical protein
VLVFERLVVEFPARVKPKFPVRLPPNVPAAETVNTAAVPDEFVISPPIPAKTLVLFNPVTI